MHRSRDLVYLVNYSLSKLSQITSWRNVTIANGLSWSIKSTCATVPAAPWRQPLLMARKSKTSHTAVLTFHPGIPCALPDGITVGATGGHSGQVRSYAAHHHPAPGCQDSRGLGMKRRHLLVLHTKPIHYLIQVIPWVTLEARGIGHWPHWDLRRPNLLVDISAVSTVPDVLELDAIALVEQGGCSRVLYQSDVVAGIVLPENFLAKNDEEDDQHENDKQDPGYSYQLLLANIRMPSLYIGNHHRAKTTVLPHIARGAVTQKWTKHVDTGATIFTFFSFTLIDVFFAP